MDINIKDNVVEVLNNGEPYFFDVGFGFQSFLAVDVDVYRDFYNWLRESGKLVFFSGEHIDENVFFTRMFIGGYDEKVIATSKTTVKDEAIEGREYFIDVYELRDYLGEVNNNG